MNQPRRLRISPRLLGWSLAAGLLLLPAIAMQLGSEVNWGLEDFLAAAVILGGAGLGIELAVRLFRSRQGRVAAVLGVVLLALLVWAELAVGIFD